MDIINFTATVIRNITLVDVGAAFMAGVFVYFATWAWQAFMARSTPQPELTAEQAERAESTREEFEGAAPIAIVTTAGVVLVLFIIGAVAVWQMAIR